MFSLEKRKRFLRNRYLKLENYTIKLIEENLQLKEKIKQLESRAVPKKKTNFRADVHTRHCCGEHRNCKYGNLDNECTVCNYPESAEFSCNCDHF